MAIRDFHPVLTMNECLDNVIGSPYFSKLDKHISILEMEIADKAVVIIH